MEDLSRLIPFKSCMISRFIQSLEQNLPDYIQYRFSLKNHPPELHKWPDWVST